MAYMDLPCCKSICLPNDIEYNTSKNEILYIGCSFETYLFFKLPPAAFLNPLKSARLILFKVPLNTAENFSIPKSNYYSIYPLLDFFSIYTNWYRPPEIDAGLGLDFKDIPCISYTEIDITTIVKAWLNEKPENKGLLLTSAPNARLMAFASNQYNRAGMRPILRLTYMGISQPLGMAPCTVRVNKKISK